jgi:hypothetical protein
MLVDITAPDQIIPISDVAYPVADRVLIPNIRYRRDIGECLMAGDLARIERFDLLDTT